MHHAASNYSPAPVSVIPAILVIEDDPAIADGVRWILKAGHQVVAVHTATQALAWLKRHSCEAIILDLHLPDMTGLLLCRRIRQDFLTMPILILTGDATVPSKVALLEAGADDYITKPFSPAELRARVRAMLRRVPAQDSGTHGLRACGLRLHPDNRCVERDGKLIILRPKEYLILECLMRHAGMIVGRDSLVNYAWGGPDVAWAKTVDVHIKHLRDKLDRPFQQQIITTIHGSGYRLEHLQSAHNTRKETV